MKPYFVLWLCIFLNLRSSNWCVKLLIYSFLCPLYVHCKKRMEQNHEELMKFACLNICVFASGVILLAFRFFIVPLGYLSLPYLCQLSMDLLHSFSRVHDYYSRHYCFFRIFYFRRGTVLY